MVISLNNNESEVRRMAVMSKPNELVFEVCESKVQDFLEDRHSGNLDRALERAERHSSMPSDKKN